MRDAEGLYTEELKRRRGTAKTHPDTYTAAYNLSGVYANTGARLLCHFSLILCSALRHHRSSALSRGDVGLAQRPQLSYFATPAPSPPSDAGRVLEAERLCMEAYSGLSGALGDSHDKTQSAASLLMQLQQARRGGGSGRSSGRYY